MRDDKFIVYLNLFVIVGLILLFVVVMVRTPSSYCERGSSYSDYNIITDDDFETLTEEYCDVYVDDHTDRQEDFFNEHDLKRFCEWAF